MTQEVQQLVICITWIVAGVVITIFGIRLWSEEDWDLNFCAIPLVLGIVILLGAATFTMDVAGRYSKSPSAKRSFQSGAILKAKEAKGGQ